MTFGRIAARVLLACVTMAAAAPAAAQGDAAAPAAASRWRIDTTHSELTFQVRHLVSRVRGSFGEWSGSLQADPGRLSEGAVEVVVQTRSIDTKNERRDNHLRTSDFFDAETHPTITFRSDRVEVEGERLRVHGTLTMRGVARPVLLEGAYLGIGRDAQGRRRMGFEASTTINRHDYGVSWNNAVESGGFVLGDDVTIQLVIAAVEQS